MPDNMDYDTLFAPPDPQEDPYQKIDRCEKALRTVKKAVLMRLFLTALLLYIPIAAKLTLGVTALMLLVVLINVSGIVPLVMEWKKRKQELDTLWDEA